MNKIPITKEGLISLKNELNKLKNVDRKNVIIAIKIAREYGDLKENAEYHAAKEEQFLIEKRIKELEEKISFSKEVDILETAISDKVMFGATVKIKDLNKNFSFEYKIVGEDEADISINKISIKSPLAKAIMFKFKNDIIDFNTPNGSIKCKIEDISYI